MRSRVAGLVGLVGLVLASGCAHEDLDTNDLVIQVVDMAGVMVPGAVVEAGYGHDIRRWTTDHQGRIHVPESEGPRRFEPRSIDGCPFVLSKRDFGFWLLVRDPELAAQCRTDISWKVKSAPGETVGWSESVLGSGLPASRGGGDVRWLADLSRQGTFDSAGNGVLAIPALLDPFRGASRLRITVRGLSFRPGWWWLDPTDSVFHVPALTLGSWIPPDWAFPSWGGLLWNGDTLRYKWGSPLVRSGGDGTRRTATIRRVDSVFSGRWDDGGGGEFVWRFVAIEGALDGLVLDTGAGAEKGVWLRKFED